MYRWRYFQGIESGSITVLHRFDVVPSSLSPRHDRSLRCRGRHFLITIDPALDPMINPSSSTCNSCFELNVPRLSVCAERGEGVRVCLSFRMSRTLRIETGSSLSDEAVYPEPTLIGICFRAVHTSTNYPSLASRKSSRGSVMKRRRAI
jgi:hypothetical protein